MSGTFQAGSIVATMALDESPTIKALEKAKNATNDFKQVAEKNLTEAGERGAEGFLRGLKEKFGRRSVFGESIELLAGGGVIAGIGMAAHSFEDAAEKVAKLSEEMRKGQLTTGEYIGEFARSLPILGDMTKGFDALREVVTGEKAALDEQTEAAKKANDAISEWGKHFEAATKGAANMADQVQRINDQLRILQAPTALKPFLENAVAAGDQIAKLKANLYQDAQSSGLVGLPKDVKDFDPATIEQRYKAVQDAITMQRKFLQDLGSPLPTPNEKDYGLFGTDIGSHTSKYESDLAAAKRSQDQRDAARQQLKDLESDAAILKKLDDEYRSFLQGVSGLHKQQAVKDADESLSILKGWWSKLSDSGLSYFHKMDDEWNKQKEEAARLKESVMTPAEKFAADADHWKSLMTGGALDQATFARLVQKDYQDQLASLGRGGGREFQPTVQAEEIFGSKTVTTADVPEPVAQTAENTRETAALLEEYLDAVKSLPESIADAVKIPTFGM